MDRNTGDIATTCRRMRYIVFLGLPSQIKYAWAVSWLLQARWNRYTASSRIVGARYLVVVHRQHDQNRMTTEIRLGRDPCLPHNFWMSIFIRSETTLHKDTK